MRSGTRYLVLGLRSPGLTTDVFEGLEERSESPRPVIIKRVRDPEDEATIRAFLEECRVLERLAHPNIVQLYDVGVEKGRPFQVFEAIDGADAAALMQRLQSSGRSLPAEVALFIT